MLKTKAFAMEGLNLMDGGEGGIRTPEARFASLHP